MRFTRRQFVVKTAQTAAAGAIAGSIWYQLLSSSAEADPMMVRPPGALAKTDFLASCIKCGNCVVACPFVILSLARLGKENTPGTPYFTARDNPCRMCEDIPCVKACPTGALDPELTDIKQSKMGIAAIDEETCLAFLGLRCEICHRVCPKIDSAITLRYRPLERTGKHALFEPIVHSDECTGCGMCEHACPTEQAAIRILPEPLIKGTMGEHYRLGWKDPGQITERFVPGKDTSVEPPSSQPALDTLNSRGKLYD